MPSTGSVGASGDLVPMANCILTFCGDGKKLIEQKNQNEIDAKTYFQNNNTTPLNLRGRDALALVNGIPFSTAFGVICLKKMNILLNTIEKTTAWLYRSLRCRKEALNNFLNSIKGHEKQSVSAQNIRREIEELGNYSENDQRSLQEIYSLRSAPQVIGACRKSFDNALETVENEINGVDDNPIFRNQTEPQVLHGANFVGQHLSFSLDQINNALTQLGNLLHQQISLLFDPELNNNNNELLAPEPGETSGLAGLEIYATAILSELRNHCINRGSSSIQTNGKNQDLVPMTFEAGKETKEQTDRVFQLVSMLGISIVQYNHLNDSDQIIPEWFPRFSPLDKDRPLQHDIARITNDLKDNQFPD